MSYEEIGSVCGISRTIVNYHLNEHYRLNQKKNSRKWQHKNMTKKKVKKRNKKYQPYNNKYIRDRYKTDPEFKRKFIKIVRKSQNKNKKMWEKRGLCNVCGSNRIDKKWVRCEKCRKSRRIHERNLKEVKRR